MIICNVVGARPNFMKMAPVINEQRIRGFEQICVHTGQHYDVKMSQVFFDELNLPRPDLYLGIGSDTHARQTARIMVEFEKFCLERGPDLVVVAGDVNSTLAAAVAASKLNIPVAHVEAGLRSFDRTMPEEINRILTDTVSELLFATEKDAIENLLHEGIPADKIHFVGNCMIDTLYRHLEKAVDQKPWTAFNVRPEAYALLTLHRPSNVDSPDTLAGLSFLVNKISESLPIIFPVHPRTAKQLNSMSISFAGRVILCEPLSYLSFLGLMAKSRFVITDSGGIQEETTALSVPCLTIRNNTERPVTIKCGTNRLTGVEPDAVLEAVGDVMSGHWPKGEKIPFWDGRAAQRIVSVIGDWSNAKAIRGREVNRGCQN